MLAPAPSAFCKLLYSVVGIRLVETPKPAFFRHILTQIMAAYAQGSDPFTPPSSAYLPLNLATGTVSAWLTDLRFDWSDVTRGYRTEILANDAMLFQEGQICRSVYVVIQGRIRLTSKSVDGKERHLMIIGPTGLVGDCGHWISKNYVVSAFASTEAVLCPVPMCVLLSALERDLLLARQHQVLVSMRFRIMLQHLTMQGANSAKRRVSHHLLGLLDSYGRPQANGTLISLSFTQQEMGNICGLSRVSVSHVLTQLEQENVIAKAGRLILVRDLERLGNWART